MAKVVWTEHALSWLREIDVYLAERSPESAVRTLEGIIARVEQIAANPRVGGRMPEKDPREVRIALYGSYQIVYELEADEIRILVIARGGIDLSRLPM